MSELAERAALQREVVGHVLSLDEPFRSIVLLRFFEDLSPPEIAKRLKVPLKTVHSRLQRAFDKLRAKLDREYGDSRRWHSAWAPLLASREGIPAGVSGSLSTSIGAALVSTHVKTGIVLTLALAGGFGLWRLTSGPARSGAFEPQQPSGLARPSNDSSTADVPAPASNIPVREATREAVETPGEAPQAPLAAPGLHVRGRAVDVRGAALEGVSIVLQGPDQEPLAVTGPGGIFEAEVPMKRDPLWNSEVGRPCLRVEDEDWLTVRQSCVQDTNQQLEHIVVAAAVTSLEGRVEDSGGAPIEGAQVKLDPRGEEFFGFPHALDLTTSVPRAESSDAAGRFFFERFPDARGLQLYVFAQGFEAAAIDLDEASWPLLIQLVRTEETDQVVLQGVVLDAAGGWVEGATVRLGDAETESDRDGLFRIPVGHLSPTTPLCAASEGRLPALIPRFGEVIERQGGTPQPVELVLGGPPLEIRGRVLDQDGTACAGWSVSIVNETEISQYTIPVDTAEDIVRGGKQVVRTDEQGRFHLTGLMPRDYIVQAFDRRSLHRTEAKVAGGDLHATLQVSREQLDAVQGVVLNRRGSPVPDVRVRLSLDIVKASVGTSSISGTKVVTDETGTFRFEDVPAAYVYLSYSGEEILPGSYVIPAEAPQGRHVIEVVQRCHFRIELSEFADRAQVAEFYDAQGKRLQVNRFEANGMSGFMSAPLKAGVSEVLSVSEDATTVVLKAGDVELSRQDVNLDPDEVNVLRL